MRNLLILSGPAFRVPSELEVALANKAIEVGGVSGERFRVRNALCVMTGLVMLASRLDLMLQCALEDLDQLLHRVLQEELVRVKKTVSDCRWGANGRTSAFALAFVHTDTRRRILRVLSRCRSDDPLFVFRCRHGLNNSKTVPCCREVPRCRTAI